MYDDIRIPWTVTPSEDACQEFFEEVREQMLSRILSFAYKLTGNWHSAEDCVQEVFSLFWQKLSNFESGRSLESWLFATTRNLAFKSNQRAKIRFMVNLEKLSLMSDGRHPLSLALSKEKSEELKKLILELPDQQRKAFLMREMEGMPYEEMGNLLGCTENSAKKACMRAKHALRDVIPTDLCENL